MVTSSTSAKIWHQMLDLAPPTNNVEGCQLASQKLLPRSKHPPRIQGNALQECANNVLPAVFQGKIEDGRTHMTVFNRASFAIDPRCVDNTIAPSRDLLCNVVHNLIHVGRLLLTQQLVLVIENLVAQESQVATCCRLQNRHQVLSWNGTGHRGERVHDICFHERHVCSDPGRRANVQMPLVVAYSSRTNGR